MIYLEKKDFTIIEKEKVDVIDEQINTACEDKEWEKLVKVLGSLEASNGGTNNTNVWKEMRKAFPKKTVSIPTGVKNIQGKVITNPKEKKTVILNHFLHRMRKRQIKEDVQEIVKTKKEALELRLEVVKEDKSVPFQKEELEKALKSLK